MGGVVGRAGQNLAAAALAHQYAVEAVRDAAGIDEAMAAPPSCPLRVEEGHA
jgi:hypothetical protein